MANAAQARGRRAEEMEKGDRVDVELIIVDARTVASRRLAM